MKTYEQHKNIPCALKTDEIGSFLELDKYFRSIYSSTIQALHSFCSFYVSCPKSSERIKMYNRFLTYYGDDVSQLAEIYGVPLARSYRGTSNAGYVHVKLPVLKDRKLSYQFQLQVDYLRNLLRLYPDIDGIYAVTHHGTGFAHVYVSSPTLSSVELERSRELLYSRTFTPYDDCWVSKIDESVMCRIKDLGYVDIYCFLAAPLIKDGILQNNHDRVVQPTFAY